MYFWPRYTVNLESTSVEIKTTSNDYQACVYTQQHLSLEPWESYVISGEMPDRYYYWTFGVYDSQSCLQDYTMGEYQLNHMMEKLVIIISKSGRMAYLTEKKLREHHRKAHPNTKINVKHFTVDVIQGIRIDLYHAHGKRNHPNYCLTKWRCLEPSNFSWSPGVKTLRKIPAIVKEVMPSNNLVLSSDYREMTVQEGVRHHTSSLKVYQNEIVIDVSKYRPLVYTDGNILFNSHAIKILALDHYMSRFAFHSHLSISDYHTGKVLGVRYTGVIVPASNPPGSQVVHIVNIPIPLGVDKILVSEKIFHPYQKDVKGYVIPMRVFVRNDILDQPLSNKYILKMPEVVAKKMDEFHQLFPDSQLF